VIAYQPMLAVSVQKPTRRDHFDFEVKFDGFRCGAVIESGHVRLVSRQGTNLSPWFPELASLPADVAGTDALLDGEIIVGSGSVESFNALLKRARLRGRSTANALPVSFVAFDLLWHDGVEWTQRTLEDRREQLRAIVTETSRIAVSRVFADGAALLAMAEVHGLEGIVAKDRRSLYEIGQRSRSWLKTKVPGVADRHEWQPT
jgi:bifunctional non-homologous end joining protein LigD